MSIFSLVDEEVIRREQTVLRERLKPSVLESVKSIAPKYGIAPDQEDSLGEDLLPLAAAAPTERTKGTNALDSLARYIPTEAITLYVAATAAMPALKETFQTMTEVRVYWFFAFLTPFLFLLIYIGKRLSAGLKAFPPLLKWPWWKLVASTVAFLVWALAIPGTPYLTGDAGKVVAAFGALLISTFLTLFEPIFER